MNKPKVLFLYDHKYPDRWMDGLWAALNVLEQDFEIEKLNLQELNHKGSELRDYQVSDFDFILGWGAFKSKVDSYLQKLSNKKGLCIAGNAFPPTGADNYDVLFYETKWYRPQISFHKNIVHAFGINSEIFNKDLVINPISNLNFATPVVWDYIGVGSLSNWKRWEKIIDKKGHKLVIGEYQKDNPDESGDIGNHLLSHNVMVSDMVSPIDLANFYKWSRVCYIPADINGGGERAVMEAKACGLKVEIEEYNPKLKEILEGPVLDEHYYAQQLKKGIMSVL